MTRIIIIALLNNVHFIHLEASFKIRLHDICILNRSIISENEESFVQVVQKLLKLNIENGFLLAVCTSCLLFLAKLHIYLISDIKAPRSAQCLSEYSE